MPSLPKEATVNNAVTVCTNGDPIVYVKAKLWKIGKAFDVMSVKVLGRAAFQALISVALSYCRTPFVETVRVARSSSFEGLPIFPCWRTRPDAISVDAWSATERYIASRKFTVAIQTELWRLKATSPCPASLRAESSIGTITMCLKRFAAYFADALNSCSTAKNRLSFNRRHSMILSLSPAYCDVIVTRWQEASGGTAIREDGTTWDELKAKCAPATEPSEF